MLTITVEFQFKHAKVSKQFDVDSYLDDNIDDFVEQYHDLQYLTVIQWDTDYADPNSFRNLEEYAKYINKCHRFGEAYLLRFDDMGENDFESDYMGCWQCTEDFTQSLVPTHLIKYIDWERYTRDVILNFDIYKGELGLHIFRR